ncbi:pilus assembly protein [Thermobifida halotolerans]|uniref:Pilus assembly protein n=1 Tax=Thermobifida halotolerans TaxID=483545 RepID=A0A399FVL5_9ACTN|nr:TadE/TadG family type IV pilus assembly protein [Thermobifida halotolerans]UOE21484.1 pilus assembly protein [Thermobifida halotolerans]
MNPRDSGNATLELAAMATALLLIVGLLVVAGRVQVSRHAVEEAARDAAREASIARTATTARTNAHAAAERTLDAQGLRCTSLHVTVDTTDFTQPPGRPGQVAATVTCRIDTSGLALPALSPRTATATVHSPLDTYRERTP